MPQSENKSSDHNTAGSQQKRFGLSHYVGLVLMNLGIVFTTMKTVNHLEQQPPEPLGFDLTLRYGDGCFISYGVAADVLGFILIGMDYRRRKAK